MLTTTLTQAVANGYHDGPPWWPIFPFLWFAFIVFVFVMIARFGWGRRRWQHHDVATGEARLAERYAAGEIDDTEYRQRLAVLRESRR